MKLLIPFLLVGVLLFTAFGYGTVPFLVIALAVFAAAKEVFGFGAKKSRRSSRTSDSTRQFIHHVWNIGYLLPMGKRRTRDGFENKIVSLVWQAMVVEVVLVFCVIAITMQTDLHSDFATAHDPLMGMVQRFGMLSMVEEVCVYCSEYRLALSIGLWGGIIVLVLGTIISLRHLDEVVYGFRRLMAFGPRLSGLFRPRKTVMRAVVENALADLPEERDRQEQAIRDVRVGSLRVLAKSLETVLVFSFVALCCFCLMFLTLNNVTPTLAYDQRIDLFVLPCVSVFGVWALLSVLHIALGFVAAFRRQSA